jgi:rSAM/selenodomain-associated transferase 2
VSEPAESAARPESLRLGVVVPTLNEGQRLGALLERLLTAPEGGRDRPGGRGHLDAADEVVVADGGSSDRTREVAREHGARVVRTAAGRGTQLAAGARELRAPLLLFLHADCTPEPGALAALRAELARTGARAAAMSQRIGARGPFYRMVEAVADLRVRALGLVYGDSGLCVERALYEEVGGFRSLPIFEDVDLSRRIARRARPRLIRSARLRVSARRWRSEGALRGTLRNWMLQAAWLAGVSPERLLRFYAPHSEEGRTT